MFISRNLVFVSLLSFVPASASAAMESYFGANYSMVSAESGGIEADPAALQLKYGAFLTEHFAVEGRAAFGVGEDTINISGVDADYEIDNAYGLYLRGVIPGQAFKPYGILGFTRGEATLSASGFGSESDSESDLSYGIGADFFFSDDMAFNIEYLQAIDKNEFEASILSIGVSYSFN